MRGIGSRQSLDETLRHFAEEVKSLYGPEILSLIVYGSAASGDYVQGRSNINTVILLHTVTAAHLRKCAKHLRRWRRQGIVTPLFFEPAYVQATANVFPAEFLDMRERHRVLHGTDFLATLQVSPAHLRFQCEQELNAKLLRLRQLYAVTAGSPDSVHRLLVKSLGSFLALFRSLLRLKGLAPPYSPEEILQKISALGLPARTLREVVELKRAGGRPSPVETEDLFERYVDEIRSVANYVGTLRGTC